MYHTERKTAISPGNCDGQLLPYIFFNEFDTEWKPTEPEQLQGDKSVSMKSPSWQIRQKMPEPELWWGDKCLPLVRLKFWLGVAAGEACWWEACRGEACRGVAAGEECRGEEWWTGASGVFSCAADGDNSRIALKQSLHNGSWYNLDYLINL